MDILLTSGYGFFVGFISGLFGCIIAVAYSRKRPEIVAPEGALLVWLHSDCHISSYTGDAEDDQELEKFLKDHNVL